MKTLLPIRRTIAVLMLSLVTLSSLAPAAMADRGGYPRHGNGGPHGREFRYQGWGRAPVIVERHSDAGPVIAGLVGGLLLGAVLSHQQPAVHVHYSYWDPYDNAGFATLGECQDFIWRHDHPRVIRVIDDSDGRCVRTLYWRHGGWSDDDD
jgi:hypothetical protein